MPKLDETSQTADTLHVSDYVRALWRGRRAIPKAVLLGAVVAAVVSLITPATYQSMTRLMPPDRQSPAGLALLANAIDDRLPSGASDALGVKSPGAVFVGVLRSRTVADRLIEQFDLMKVYRVRLRKDARRRLADSTEIAEDKKSGIITLTVTDRSAARAASLARAYVEQLNQLTAELNTSAAHRERVFLEERLKKVKQDLAAASARLSQFSSRSSAVDPKEQGKALFDTAARLQVELSDTEAELRSLEQVYAPQNVRVRAARARIAELKRQIAKLQGSNGAPASLPSITQLPVLGLTYADLLREAKVQEAVYETLTKQYELAKVQEARELPTVRVLDDADLPERRVSPQRTLMTLAGFLLGGVFAAAYVIGRTAWRRLSLNHPVRTLGLEFHDDIAAELRTVRRRLARARTSQ